MISANEIISRGTKAQIDLCLAYSSGISNMEFEYNGRQILKDMLKEESVASSSFFSETPSSSPRKNANAGKFGFESESRCYSD